MLYIIRPAQAGFVVEAEGFSPADVVVPAGLKPSAIITKATSVAYQAMRLTYFELPFQSACRIWADPNLECARLDRVAHVQANKAQLADRHVELHGALFARLEQIGRASCRERGE